MVDFAEVIDFAFVRFRDASISQVVDFADRLISQIGLSIHIMAMAMPHAQSVRINVTPKTPAYFKFEEPMHVEIAICNTSPDMETYDSAFLEIRGVTIKVKEISPMMVVNALGTNPSFTLRYHDRFPNSIAKDLYMQAKKLFNKLRNKNLPRHIREEAEAMEQEWGMNEGNVIFDMSVIKRPHHSMVVIEQDIFMYG